MLIYPKITNSGVDKIKINQDKIEKLEIQNDSILKINDKLRNKIQTTEGNILLIDKQIQNSEWEIQKLNYQNDLLVKKINKMSVADLEKFFEDRYGKY